MLHVCAFRLFVCAHTVLYCICALDGSGETWEQDDSLGPSSPRAANSRFLLLPPHHMGHADRETVLAWAE